MDALTIMERIRRFQWRTAASMCTTTLLFVAWAACTPANAAAPATTGPAGRSVLDRLVLSAPTFRAAVDRGDIGEARHLLAVHFASRPRLKYAPELFGQAADNPRAGNSYVRDRPDFVLQNRFANIYEYVTAGSDIDWNGRFGRGDSETTWWINRFFFLLCLEQEYDRTKDAQYPRRGVELILDWIRKNPIDRAEKSWGAWRTLEIGLRLAEWSRFVDRFAAERIIKPGELTTILASLREQTEYLVAHSGPGRGNWGFMEQCGIGVVALVFPEFRDADRWLSGVFHVYRTDVRQQIYVDGSHQEMTVHYGFTVVWSLARLTDLARQRRRLVPPELTDALRRAATYSTLTVKPDLTLPMLNDGDAIDLTPFLLYLARTLDLPEPKYVLTRGREGTPPPLCRMFGNSGLAIFRDSWKPGARCLLFDAGPFGTGHQHEDALQLDVAAFGRSFIVDPGRYTYVPGPWRDYFVGTRSHATIMVDGGQQVRARHPGLWRGERPITNEFVANDDLALAVGDYTAGYDAPAAKGVMHRREALFVNHEYWVISDVLLGSGRHRIEQTFQYTPGSLKVSENTAVTGHTDANLAMLWFWPAKPEASVRTGQENPPVGWYSPVYGRKEPAPHLTLSADLELPVRIMLVLYPFRTAEMPAIRGKRELALDARRLDAVRVDLQIGARNDDVWLRDGDLRLPRPAHPAEESPPCHPTRVTVHTGGNVATLPVRLREIPFNSPAAISAPSE
jgi:hypothetical protein